MSPQLILALDIGTSGVRGALFDARGRLIKPSLVRHGYRPATTRDFGSTLDAEAVFALVVRVINSVLLHCDGEIAFIASSSLWHTLVGIDKNLRPTTPAFTWADNRSRERVRHLRRRFDEEEIHNRVGARFHSSYWPAKLLSLRSTDIVNFRRTEKWLSLPDYLTLRFCGRPDTSISMASGTGIFDIRSLRWDRQLCRFLQIPIKNLPSIASDDGFPLLENFVRRWPQLKNARWLPAIGDGAAANLGSGCVWRGLAALSIGTSAAIRIFDRGQPPAKIPPGLFCYRYDSEYFLLGGALSDGGGALAYLSGLLGREGFDKSTDREILRRPVTENGLIFLPFINGERSTGFNEFATGGILGLTAATDAVDILKAAIEGIGFRLAAIADQIGEVTAIKQIIGSGGAFCASPAIRQTIADILGREIFVARDCEASLRGAALHAAKSAGKIVGIDSVAKLPRSIVKPDAGRKIDYGFARRRHDRIYQLLSSIENNETE